MKKQREQAKVKREQEAAAAALGLRSHAAGVHIRTHFSACSLQVDQRCDAIVDAAGIMPIECKQMPVIIYRLRYFYAVLQNIAWTRPLSGSARFAQHDDVAVVNVTLSDSL